MAKEIYSVIKPVADLRENPQAGTTIGRRDSQLLFGEKFEKTGENGDYIQGKALHDGYSGYVRKSDLALKTKEPTHYVAALATNAHPEPDFKTWPLLSFSFLSRLTIEKTEGDFAYVAGQGWFFKEKIKPLPMTMADPVSLAEKFIGAPYLYGGRSAYGLDCSALVQLALMACGIPCPRDSDQQIVIGNPMEEKDIQRGDLVFFKGHVGIMTSKNEILNANARTMDVRIEKLSDLTSHYKGITAIRRI